jgi:hypothetical protein
MPRVGFELMISLLECEKIFHALDIEATVH